MSYSVFPDVAPRRSARMTLGSAVPPGWTVHAPARRVQAGVAAGAIGDGLAGLRPRPLRASGHWPGAGGAGDVPLPVGQRVPAQRRRGRGDLARAVLDAPDHRAVRGLAGGVPGVVDAHGRDLSLDAVDE